MNLKFRPAQQNDLPAIVSLLGELFSIERDFTPDPARQLAALKLMLPREDMLLLVAEVQVEGVAQVAGFCSVQSLMSTAEGGSVGMVEDVVVAGPWRGQNVGRRLLEAAETWARRRGMSRIQLLADENNGLAQDFYRQLGWDRGNMRNWRKIF